MSFTAPRPIAAEGARIGVVTCLVCGAAVVIDPADERENVDPLALHREYHERREGRVE